MVGRGLSKLWTGRCDIFVLQKVKDPETRRTVSVETLLVPGEPCRLSFESIPATGESAPVAQVSQSTKLFLSNTVETPPGSKFVVTQNGVTTVYKQSGVPAVYSSHKEILLELFTKWS